jgi:hypothetical protein
MSPTDTLATMDYADAAAALDNYDSEGLQGLAALAAVGAKRAGNVARRKACACVAKRANAALAKRASATRSPAAPLYKSAATGKPTPGAQLRVNVQRVKSAGINWAKAKASPRFNPFLLNANYKGVAGLDDDGHTISLPEASLGEMAEGLGFLKKIGKMISRNKNTLLKVGSAVVGAVASPAAGAALYAAGSAALNRAKPAQIVGDAAGAYFGMDTGGGGAAPTVQVVGPVAPPIQANKAIRPAAVTAGATSNSSSAAKPNYAPLLLAAGALGLFALASRRT